MKTQILEGLAKMSLISLALLVGSCTEARTSFDSPVTPDYEAPSLISVTPENGDIAAASKTILLTFNERVKVGDAQVTFNGKDVVLTCKDKTASYTYNELDYSTACTFVVSSGAITDMSGNPYAGTQIQFSITERPQPDARTFDVVVRLDGKGNYKTIQNAIDAVPKNRTEPWLIFVANGTYEEQVIIAVDKPYIHLIGQDVDKTIINYWIISASVGDDGW